MTEKQEAAQRAARFSIDKNQSLAIDVHEGFTKPLKEISPKHLYDTRGSELFEHICELPEYYPTRTELKILKSNAAKIIELAQPVELVELGSGATTKARVLLDAMQNVHACYTPVDIAQSMIKKAVDELEKDYPDLSIHGFVADFIHHIEKLPAAANHQPRLFALFGGTVGNLPPDERHQFFQRIASVMQANDFLLIGTDLVKEPAIIEAAYNDQAGITAEFNRNLLHVLNRELDADFVVENFHHRAFYNKEHQWIEMRLCAQKACTVRIRALDLVVEFAAGEEIRTEISTKFTLERLTRELQQAGLTLNKHFTDADNLFGLSLITRRQKMS